MLSMTHPFTDMDIEDVSILRSGTVYKLSGHAGEKIVIKCETSYSMQNSFDHSAIAMRAAKGGGGNAKKLEPSELQALRDWVDFMKRVTNDFNQNKLSDFSAGPSTQDLSQCLTNPLWYKMPFEDLSSVDKVMADRVGENGSVIDKSTMRQFLEGLKAPGGLEQIGKIIAADCYIGNTDRFNPYGVGSGDKKQYGSRQLKFRVLLNPGNIFIIGKNTQQRITFSGHDFMDPASDMHDYTVKVSDVGFADGQDWHGKYLVDDKLRAEFAKNVIHDLELVLTPNKSSLSPFRKLSKDCYKRVKNGMEQGMRDIVQNVPKSYGRGNPMPVGAKDRCRLYAEALKIPFVA